MYLFFKLLSRVYLYVTPRVHSLIGHDDKYLMYLHSLVEHDDKYLMYLQYLIGPFSLPCQKETHWARRDGDR